MTGPGRRRRGGDALGACGERFAAGHLVDAGYRILDRNRVFGRYELDLLALDPDGRTVVIVEVKTRRGDFLPGEAAVDRRKRLHLRRVAAMIADHPAFAGRPLRVDVIAIRWADPSAPAPDEVRHFVDAFDGAG